MLGKSRTHSAASFRAGEPATLYKRWHESWQWEWLLHSCLHTQLAANRKQIVFTRQLKVHDGRELAGWKFRTVASSAALIACYSLMTPTCKVGAGSISGTIGALASAFFGLIKQFPGLQSDWSIAPDTETQKKPSF